MTSADPVAASGPTGVPVKGRADGLTLAAVGADGPVLSL
jgi:hypothetical protein